MSGSLYLQPFSTNIKMRNYLNNKHRIAIQKEIRPRRQNDESVRLQYLADWAQETLRFPFTPSRRVFSRLSSASSLAAPIPDNAKKSRKQARPAIEARLVLWINDQNQPSNCIKRDMIRVKATRLLSEVNTLQPREREIWFKFTNGWLRNFQRRLNLKARNLHGESDYADNNAIRALFTSLLSIGFHYRHADIWNADETGLNYAKPRTAQFQLILFLENGKVR